MGRYDHRIRRLEQQVKGRHASLWQARLAQMTYDELLAHVMRDAVKHGMPEEMAKGDPEAALAWAGEYLRHIGEERLG